jgi:glycosyltransferase involved in cell wall biosynthesis
MPPITALLHTRNDALRLGRALETLLPCAEILIVDHDSSDATHRIARQYGARVVGATRDAGPRHYLDLAANDWIFCLDPRESLTESLQVSLFEWSALPPNSVGEASAYSVPRRYQIDDVWLDSATQEVRLVPRNWALWCGELPVASTSAIPLQGKLLSFAYP